jgi:MFS family permease
MPSVLRYVRGLRYDFPRGVYVLQAGLVINAFGNGAANPFVLLYLHNVRGIHLAVAGLVAATSATCALAGSLLSGSSADRRGAVPTMVGGLVCSAAGFALYPLVREPWQAFGAAALTGTGVGVWLTMQSNVLAQVTPPDVRHAAFAQQRVAANIGLGLGGFVGGLIVTVGQPATFTVLFLLNATTFLVYTAFLIELRLPRPTRAVEAARAGEVIAASSAMAHSRGLPRSILSLSSVRSRCSTRSSRCTRGTTRGCQRPRSERSSCSTR